MKNKFLLALATIGLSGVLFATPTVKLYDFTKVICTGDVADNTSVTLTVNGLTGDPITATDTFSGAYTLQCAVTAGKTYTYTVKEGETTVASGSFTAGNDGAALFGANAATAPAGTGGNWDEQPTVTESMYVFAGSKSAFAPTTSPNGVVRIDSTIEFTGGADDLDDELEALGSFTLAQDDNDAYYWAGLASGGWKTLTCTVDPNVGTYETRMEFDLTAKKVRYLIKSGSTYVALSAGGAEWFSMAKDAPSVSSVSYEGTGKLAQFSASSLETDVAQVNSTGYDTFEKALKAAGNQVTVTKLTHVTVTPAEELIGTYTLNGVYDCKALPVVGYTADVTSTSLAIAAFVTDVKVTVSGEYGYDFTNGTLRLDFTGSQIQEGDTSVSAEVTVYDKTGAQVGSTHKVTEITGGEVDVAIPESLTAEQGYTYDVVIKKDDVPVKETKSTFVPGVGTGWFSANQTNWGYNGEWNITIEPGTEKLALTDTEYVFTANAPDASNDFVQVDTVVEVTGALAIEDLPEVTGTVQGMITLSEVSETDATPTWKAYNGSSWINLTGAPTVAGTYTIRAEFDYTGDSNKVRYSVGQNGVFSVLSAGAASWLDNGNTTAQTLASTAAMGSGALVSLVGNHYDAFVAEVDGVKYKTAADAIAASKASGKPITYLWDCTVPGEKSQEIGGRKVMVDEAFLAANPDLLAKGENGLTKIESYVLGLDPADKNSKPVTATEQNAKPDKITLSVAKAKTEAGWPVKFALKSAMTPDLTDASPSTPQDSEVFEIDLPSDKVKYYKIEAIFE